MTSADQLTFTPGSYFSDFLLSCPCLHCLQLFPYVTTIIALNILAVNSVTFCAIECICSVGIAGYVSVCVQLYCVGFHCLSLQVSTSMAIFRCVGFFIYIFAYAWRILLRCFLWLAAFFHVVTLCTFSICEVVKILGIIICCFCYFWYCYK
jgi:hypothetical protein